MITIRVLENDDVIKQDDWCRPLHIVSMSGGHSDHYSFESYGRPVNNAKWVRVGRSLPAWIGKTLADFGNHTDRFNEWEIVRGNLPANHIHKDGEITEYDYQLFGLTR